MTRVVLSLSQYQRPRCPTAQPRVRPDDVHGFQKRGASSHRGPEARTGAAELQDQSHGNTD
jgi:hypothetical protein